MSSLGFSDEQIKYELSSNLHSRILDILVYGMYTSIYFVALYLTLSRGAGGPRVGSAVLLTVIWIFITVHAGFVWAHVDYAYIQHGESQETQLISFFVSKNRNYFPQLITNAVVTYVSLLLADVTMIWRCWVVYGRRWISVIIPALFLTAGSVCYIIRIVWIYRAEEVTRPDEIANMELIYLSTTVFTNIFCTTAIIVRVLMVRGWRKSLRTYHGLLEILIESSILYTAVFLIRIGLRVHTQYFTKELDERALFAQVVGFSVTGIAPTLIIARVAAGHAQPDDSWINTTIPTLKPTMRSFAESLRFARPATSMSIHDVELERSALGGNTVEDGCRPAFGEQDKGRGQTSFKQV